MKEVKTPKKPLIYYYGIVLLVLIVFNLVVSPILMEHQVEETDYGTFMSMIDAKNIGEVEVEDNQIVFTDKNNEKIYKTGLMNDPELTDRLYKCGATFAKDIDQQTSPIISFLVTGILPLLIFIALGNYMAKKLMEQAGGKNSMAFGMGKSNAKVYVQSSEGIRFADVAGEDEAKENLAEIVDYLHNPKKYTDVGASMPKGVLLVGPPGTGKTMLAKAVAGEANVPFFSMSGSEFVEMFVGMGASKVRDLFKQAKEKAPCIVFIDEIDAIGKKRDGQVGGNDEREQTLNQLLVEMDGFGVNEGIIVMAATNRVDILDPAILRPGRFDRKVGVGRPDIQGRREILEVHAKGKPLGDDVDLDQIARTTAGFTGADLENLMNEAAIYAAKQSRAYIVQDDIRRAFVKVGIGAEKKSRVISDKEKKITAYHESGHALLFHLLPDVGPVYSVSIIPTGIGAAGYTMPLPERDNMFNTKGKMMQDIVVSLGGRVAEELIFDDITTGASQDIKTATETARAMVTEYGMSDAVGLINYTSGSDEVFIGRDIGHSKPYGEGVAAVIDQEVKRIVDGCHQEARRIITEHMEELHACADMLIEKEKITREEFEAIFPEGTEDEKLRFM